MAEKKDTKLDIRQIYIKDLSFESPQTPRVIANPEQNPGIDIQMGINFERLDENGHYEVVLNITVTAKTGEATLFLTEVQQAGLFQLQGFSEEEMGLVLHVACPTILLPFARTAIADIVSKGGFPQLLISPVNFEALYARKLQQEKSKSDDAADTAGTKTDSTDGVTIN